MRKSLLLYIAIMISTYSFPQYLRTSYFMESSSNRMQLNPALRPSQGFVDIPVIGAFHASAVSNTLGVNDIIDIIDSKEKFLENEKLFERLKTDNFLNVNLNTDIASFGFYRGKDFWSGSIGVRTDINASIPLQMLEFSRDFLEPDELTFGTYDIRNQTLNANVYTEVGLGYSTMIGKKFTFGTKVKVLLGIGNLNFEVDQLYIHAGMTHSELISSGKLDVSMVGVDIETQYDNYDGKEYIDDIDFKKLGLAGHGMAIDVGFTYKLLNNLTFSAALLDFGAITWSKKHTTSATASKNLRIDYNEILNDIPGFLSSDGIFDFSLPGFEIKRSRERTTFLPATLVLGAECGLPNNKLSVGVLYVSRYTDPKTISELTFSGNLRPTRWFNATISYSVLQNYAKTFGIGFKLGPLFVGTDYMLLQNLTNARNVNAYLGISIPLSRMKN